MGMGRSAPLCGWRWVGRRDARCGESSPHATGCRAPTPGARNGCTRRPRPGRAMDLAVRAQRPRGTCARSLTRSATFNKLACVWPPLPAASTLREDASTALSASSSSASMYSSNPDSPHRPPLSSSRAVTAATAGSNWHLKSSVTVTTVSSSASSCAAGAAMSAAR
eukprot:5559670-Prymnesium_polylepis.1